jgi:hypothetical protein
MCSERLVADAFGQGRHGDRICGIRPEIASYLHEKIYWRSLALANHWS